MFKNKGRLIVIVVVVILVLLFFMGLDFYTDLAWFQTLGITSVLWKRIAAGWLLLIIAWVFSAAILAGNWWLARRLAGGGDMVMPWMRAEQSQIVTNLSRRS